MLQNLTHCSSPSFLEELKYVMISNQKSENTLALHLVKDYHLAQFGFLGWIHWLN